MSNGGYMLTAELSGFLCRRARLDSFEQVAGAKLPMPYDQFNAACAKWFRMYRCRCRRS